MNNINNDVLEMVQPALLLKAGKSEKGAPLFWVAGYHLKDFTPYFFHEGRREYQFMLYLENPLCYSEALLRGMKSGLYPEIYADKIKKKKIDFLYIHPKTTKMYTELISSIKKESLLWPKEGKTYWDLFLHPSEDILTFLIKLFNHKKDVDFHMGKLQKEDGEIYVAFDRKKDLVLID
ncbi:hypothetical protein ACFL35_18630 [Candidatus Riflebacteria bacterium]